MFTTLFVVFVMGPSTAIVFDNLFSLIWRKLQLLTNYWDTFILKTYLLKFWDIPRAHIYLECLKRRLLTKCAESNKGISFLFFNLSHLWHFLILLFQSRYFNRCADAFDVPLLSSNSVSYGSNGSSRLFFFFGSSILRQVYTPVWISVLQRCRSSIAFLLLQEKPSHSAPRRSNSGKK